MSVFKDLDPGMKLLYMNSRFYKMTREMQDIVDKHMDKKIKLSNNDLHSLQTQIDRCINIIKNHHYNCMPHIMAIKKNMIKAFDNQWDGTIISINKYCIFRLLKKYKC